MGIKEEDMQHLFRMFSRLGEGTRLDKNGIGLGLSICKTIVGQFGGKVCVSSEFGKGSVFSFTFLLDSQPEEEKEDIVIEIKESETNQVDENLMSDRSLKLEDQPLLRRNVTNLEGASRRNSVGC